MTRRLNLAIAAAVLAASCVAAWPAAAEKLAVSQYGRITGSLPWVIAMKKGYFKDEGLAIDEIVAGAGGGTSLRNMLASEVGYAEVATSAALAAMRAGIDLKIVNAASHHIGEIALVTMPGKPIHPWKDCTVEQLAERFETVRRLGGDEVWLAEPNEVVEYIRMSREKGSP